MHAATTHRSNLTASQSFISKRIIFMGEGINDYVANIPLEKQTDNDRVYPGDGIAPWSKIIQILKEMGTPKVLSLELFNKEYWKQDPLEVAKTGLMKMKKLVETNP